MGQFPWITPIEPESFETFLEERLEREVGVQLRNLAVDGGSVTVEYGSQYADGQREATNEIGNVAVVYAIAVGEGWEVDQLEATLDDANDDRFVFVVESESAHEWLGGELTDDEFGDAVVDTVEPAA